MVDPAPRLEMLAGKRVALLDCGKRGGRAFLEALEPKLTSKGAACRHVAKPSAHRMASRKLIESLSGAHDAVVYGVVD